MAWGGSSTDSIVTAGERRTRKGKARSLYLYFFLLGALLPLEAQGPPPSPPATPTDVPALLRVADEALGRGDFSTAAKSLKTVVETQPRLTAAWFNLAYAYSGLRQNEQAVEAYQKALGLQPDLFEARLNLGILFIEMKRAEMSLEHLEKAVALNPQHPRAHLYYGRALSLAGQPEAAEKQFQEVLRLNPTLAIAHFDLGQLYLGQRRYTEARTAFQKAAELDPQLAPAQLGIALASEGLSDLAGAGTHFERYLVAKPDDLETRFHLAKIYLQQAKTDLALEALQAVYETKPDMPGLAAALGDVCALLRRFGDSEKFYRQALAASSGETDLHRALGQTLLDEEKFKEAEGEFRVTLNLDPQNREAAKGLASSVYLQKRYTEAVPLLEALTRGPDPPAGLFFVLATCYDHLLNLQKALEAYDRYLELSRGVSPDQEWQAEQRAKLLRRKLRR